jgi:hypothetical protein
MRIAHLWLGESWQEWGGLVITVDSFDLLGPLRYLTMAPLIGNEDSGVVPLLSRQFEKELWLTASRSDSGLLLNGWPLVLGMQIPANKDELRIPGFPPIRAVKVVPTWAIQ